MTRPRIITNYRDGDELPPVFNVSTRGWQRPVLIGLTPPVRPGERWTADTTLGKMVFDSGFDVAKMPRRSTPDPTNYASFLVPPACHELRVGDILPLIDDPDDPRNDPDCPPEELEGALEDYAYELGRGTRDTYYVVSEVHPLPTTAQGRAFARHAVLRLLRGSEIETYIVDMTVPFGSENSGPYEVRPRSKNEPHTRASYPRSGKYVHNETAAIAFFAVSPGPGRLPDFIDPYSTTTDSELMRVPSPRTDLREWTLEEGYMHPRDPRVEEAQAAKDAIEAIAEAERQNPSLTYTKAGPYKNARTGKVAEFLIHPHGAGRWKLGVRPYHRDAEGVMRPPSYKDVNNRSGGAKGLGQPLREEWLQWILEEGGVPHPKYPKDNPGQWGSGKSAT